MRRATVLSILAFSTLCQGMGSRLESPPNPSPPGKRTVEIDFQLFRGYIIVAKGSVGHLNDLNFLIDTGAVPSVVSSRVAGKLGLKCRPAKLSVFTKQVEAKAAVLPQLNLGPIRLQDHPVLVEDFGFIDEALGVQVDAMIGLDVLGWCNFAIDYPARKLIFGARLPDSPRVPMEVGPGCMVIRARAGQNQLRLMVDTGAPGLMLYEKGFKKKFPNARRLGKRKLSNLGGKKSLKEVQIPPFKLGGEDFGKLKALLIKCPDRQAPAFDGLLGLTSLELARVYFDFNRQMLSYQRRRK